MKTWILEQTLGLVLPLVVGLLVPPIMKALKATSDAIGRLSPDLQRGVVVLISGLGTALGTFLGVQVTGDPTLWSSADINAIVSAAIAFSIHASTKAQETRAITNAARAEWSHRMDAGESPFRLPEAPARDRS